MTPSNDGPGGGPPNDPVPAFGEFLDGFYDASTQVRRNVYRRTSERLAAGRAANDLLATPGDVLRRQAELRKLAVAALGGDLTLPEDVPHAVRTGSVARDGYRIDKLILDIGGDVLVPANLYLPDGPRPPSAAVLFLCGHGSEGKAAPRYQAMCAKLASAGLVTLVFDSIGQGERKSYRDRDGHAVIPDNVPEHNHVGIQCWWADDTLARYFVHDARRALDYLLARPEVDPTRVAAAGNSGGGTLTTWLMLVEPRIAAAVPSCYISTREDYQRSGQAQDPEQIIPGGTLDGLDHEDFLIAMAPRPTLVMSANYDFFPVEGAVRSVARAQRIFDLLGAPDGSLAHVRVDRPHGLSSGLAEAGVDFLTRQLGRPDERPAAGSARPPQPVDAEGLQCTVTGQIATDIPRAKTVFQLNRERLAADRGSGGGLAWLRNRVNAHREPPAELFPRWWPARTPGVRKGFWWSEHDILNAAVVFDPPGEQVGTDIVALDRGTDDLPAELDACRRAAGLGRRVLVLDVRATGATAAARINDFPLEANYGTMFKLVSDLIFLGDSLGAARVHDLLRCVQLVDQDPTLARQRLPIRLVGSGHGAFLARLAGALEPRVAEVVLLTEPLDPATMVNTRYYGPDRDSQCLIPGMARHVSARHLAEALQGRVGPAAGWHGADVGGAAITRQDG